MSGGIDGGERGSVLAARVAGGGGAAVLFLVIVLLWVARPYSQVGTVGATIAFVVAIAGLAAIADPGSVVSGALRGYQHAADRISEVVGWVAKWLVPICVAIGFVNVLLRYIGRFTRSSLASTGYIDLQWQLLGGIFLFGFPYVLKHGVNVRVDFVFQRYPAKVKALIDFCGHLLSLVPFTLFVIWVQWAEANRAVFSDCRPRGTRCDWRVWQIWERSGDPGGLPRGPIKVLLLVGFALLLMQTIAEIIKLGFALGRRRGDVEVEALQVDQLRVQQGTE